MSTLSKIAVVFLIAGMVIPSFAQDVYKLGPDSQRKEGVPQGKVTKYTWVSKIYPNTTREYSVYVPVQYNAASPAALMIFQDGNSYLNETGDFRTTIVFDNLIARKEMPVTIGLFINPGNFIPETPEQRPRSNRSQEYDDLSDTYVRMLLEEIIPEVSKSYNISTDRKMHAIAGLSSGAICAFTAAWLRTDYFSKVLSHFGSYTNIKGGHQYPAFIRKEEKKDIKVYMQDGSADLNNQYGNWWLANQQMASSLEFKGYEVYFAKGTQGHSGQQGGSLLPESMKWLWSDVVVK